MSQQTLVELNKLSSDIKDLERQQRSLNQGADHRLSKVKAKVELVEQQLSQTKQKTREVLASLREIEKDNAKLKLRITQIKNQIVQERKRKDGLHSKRVRLTEEGQGLRTQVHKLEKAT